MGSYTYPVKHLEGSLTKEQIHLLLSNPRLISKRIANILQMRFIADWLLTGRFNAQGGGVFYETGEEIFADDSPESIQPGAEYPKTVLSEGDIVAAKTTKWGLATDITDEKIARQGISHVNKGLRKLGNTIIRNVDGVAMAVVASKVGSVASPSGWTTAGKVVEALTTIQGARANLGLGIDLDSVVLKPAKFAKLVGILVDDKALPREEGNLVVTGQIPFDAFGFTWATTPFYLSDNPLLVDREQLGGMADEDLGSPGYVRGANGVGVETLVDRDKGKDKYVLQARRVTVPVVTEPLAGTTITGTGL